MEIWKDITGYEGKYKISSLGRVKSLERLDSIGRRVKESILIPIISGRKKCEYYSVGLHKGDKKKVVKIHILVAMEFLGYKPDNTNVLVVNHKDLDKLNNNLYNLEIISNRENCNKKHIKHSSIYTGVHFYKRDLKWKAQIQVNGKIKYLGMFDKEIDASNAYELALTKI